MTGIGWPAGTAASPASITPATKLNSPKFMGAGYPLGFGAIKFSVFLDHTKGRSHEGKKSRSAKDRKPLVRGIRAGGGLHPQTPKNSCINLMNTLCKDG